MQPLALTLALALVAPVGAAPDAPPAAATLGDAADPSPAGPELASSPSTQSAAAPAAPSARRVWGVGLLAGGSALLAATATSAALVEALARPDDRNDPLENPELLQGISFATMLVGAASVGAMLAGGALVITE